MNEPAIVAVRSSATAEDLPSISGKEHSIIKIGEKIIYDEIENIYEQINDTKEKIFVPSMKNNNAEWLEATSLYRHPAQNSKLYKITTETGREITISPNHTLIILDEETMKPKNAEMDEIKKGTKVPVTATIPITAKEEEINTAEYVFGENVSIQENKVMIKNNSTNWKIQHALPQHIKPSKEFAYFLGMYIAEGSTYKNNLISITNSNEKLLEKSTRFLKKEGIYKEGKLNKYSIRAYCPALVRFMHSACGKPIQEKKGKGKLCYTKKVPGFVFEWKKETIGEFLQGCFDGDGTISSGQISYCTTSKMLAGGIIKLLEMLEINFYLKQKKNAYTISVSLHDNEKYKKLIGFYDETKNEKLEKAIKEYEKRPKHPEFKNTFSLTTQFSNKLRKEFEKKLPTTPVEEYYSGNIKWDSVKEIIPIEYTGWVYDFEVPETQNFAAGMGGIITHNSASFAGQQETYLNIQGEEQVVKAVQKCWASLFTARAVYYRKKQGFGTEKVGLCAVVQKMVESAVSGIMFTADPTGDLNKIIIEAGFGLGETIVSGSVTPDNYVINKATMEITNKKINKQEWMLIKQGRENVKVNLGLGKASAQKLANDKIIELAKIGKHIEEHYKKPMDIEWAMQDNNLFIVQARPITTLNIGKKIKEEKIKAHGEVLLEGLSASPGIVTGKVKVAPEIKDIEKVKQGDILATKMTSPDWVPVMKRASGIITNEGGATCHAAIVSRELGIPCVVGTERATETLEDGQEVTIDGFNGKIYSGKVEIKHEEKKVEVLAGTEIDKIEKMLEKSIEEDKKKQPIIKRITSIVREFGGIRYKEMNKEKQEEEAKELLELLKDLSIKVKVNVALPDAAEQAAATNADGVGLLRAEHMITSSGMHPAEFIRENKDTELKDTVKKGIKIVAEKFPNKPVWFRTFDARSDEYKELVGGDKEPKEENPMIGWHGIRRDLDEPRMLKAQLTAIKELHSEGLKNVGVMLPFVVSLEEVIVAKRIAHKVGLQNEVPIGVMVETPAAVWIIDELIPHIKFVSFGTNDLTQLTLGMDRNNERIQKNFSELHPAILRQLEYVIKKCKVAGVSTSICGQAASNPEMVKKLIWYGIDSVSANIDAVDEIRKVVMQEEKKKIMEMHGK
jgi:pyruvate,water dikinase